MARYRLLKQALRDIVSAKTNFLTKVRGLVRFVKFCYISAELPGHNSLNVPKEVREAASQILASNDYNPDAEFDALKNPALNPVIAFHEALKGGTLSPGNPFKDQKISIAEATVFEAHFDYRGKILRDPKALESVAGHGKWPAYYRLRTVKGTESYRALFTRSEKIHEGQPTRSTQAKILRQQKIEAVKKLKEDGLIGWDFLTGDLNTQYDPNQYTEFAPTMGGPFFKQLYLYDMLKMYAYAFEANNHNPIAKRIVDLISQYTFGRRFDVRIKDPNKSAEWEKQCEIHDIKNKLSNFWGRETIIYGEFMLDYQTMQTIDPSTVWDIVTDPDNVNDEYYFYQSYPTAYQMFTGHKVPGEPGSEKQAASEYILRQIPAHNVLHEKFNCVSNEKRGRSLLFPILGWLKRIKDLYNAMVIRQWLLSCFVWDVTIKGNQSDVQSYAAQYPNMPPPGSTHVHNEAVTRAPMPAMGDGGRGSGGPEIAEAILAFIATANGMPKEFLNVMSTGGGSRANALTSAEPFSKYIEDFQSRWESIITKIFKHFMFQAGMTYQRGDIEVIFPSVTKDTTTEFIQNLVVCESQGWFTNKMCGEMAAKEMNVTNYDWDEVKSEMKDEQNSGYDTLGKSIPPPPGRMGNQPEDDSGSEIHGQGKMDLASDLKTL